MGKGSGFFKNRARPLGNLIKPIGSTDDHKSFFGKVFGTIWKAFLLLAGKSTTTNEPVDYHDIAQRWGITEENRPLVIRGHYVEFVLFMLIGIFGLVSIYYALFVPGTFVGSASQMVGGLMMITVAIARSTILMWRLDILRNKTWISYPQWLGGHNTEDQE